jgi:hypothetical protein
LPRYRVIWADVERWRFPTLISKRNARRWIAARFGDLKQNLISLALSAVLCGTGWLFWDFLEPGSAPFYVAIVFMFVVIVLVILKYYLVSLLAFIALIGFVPVLDEATLALFAALQHGPPGQARW